MINKDWTVSSLVHKFPNIIKVLRKYQISASCWGGDGRLTLEQAALKHSIAPDHLIHLINEQIQNGE